MARSLDRWSSAPVGCGRTAGECRAGATLLELLVTMAVMTLLGAALCALLITQLRVARSLMDRAQAGEAVRLTAAALQGEARRLAAADVRALAADSLAIRAFRGIGVPCHSAGATVHVRYRGDRLPEPAKDSVLAVGAGAGAGAVALLDARPGTHAMCSAGPGERVLQLRLAEPLDSAAVMLVFESGRYFISNRALRYRLGAEGRQPLTAELLLAGSRFEAAAGGQIRFRLVTRAAGPVELAAPIGSAASP
jgi:type II secretory pathway pseudopilin PulG